MEQLTKNQAVATSQEAVQNQNEPQLRDENAHNDKSVHGVLNPTYQAGLRRDAVQPDIEAERKKRDNQKELTKMQLDNQKEIAEMQNETQKEIAGIQSATSRQNTKDQVYAQNEMLAYQQKESTARVASIMENTNLSK